MSLAVFAVLSGASAPLAHAQTIEPHLESQYQKFIEPTATQLQLAYFFPVAGGQKRPAPAARSGPLEVQWTTRYTRVVTQEKTGQIAYKDSSGNTFATADVYQDVSYDIPRAVWLPLHDGKAVDEVTFYELAEQQATADRVYRKPRPCSP